MGRLAAALASLVGALAADEPGDAIDRYLAARRSGDLAAMTREARAVRERGPGARDAVDARLAERARSLQERLAAWPDGGAARARRVREDFARSLRALVANDRLLPEEGASDAAVSRAVERAGLASALATAATTREAILAEGLLDGWSNELEGLLELAATLGPSGPLPGPDLEALVRAAARPVDPAASDPAPEAARKRDGETEQANASSGLADGDRALLAEINAYRAAAGLPKLLHEPRLAAAARAHAEEMSRLGYFAHRSPTRGRARPADRVAAEGYPWGAVGEVLARGDFPPRAILEAWWASPGHHRALLMADAVEAGVARVGDHWVAVFARRRR